MNLRLALNLLRGAYIVGVFMKYRVEASQESGSTQAWELSRLNCLCWDTGTLKMQTKMLAAPIIQFLFNEFGQKIRVKRYRIYCGLHQFQNPTYLPGW